MLEWLFRWFRSTSCPHCRTRSELSPQVVPTRIHVAVLQWICPACGGGWWRHRMPLNEHDGLHYGIYTSEPCP